jgi:hypothetical protein
LQAGTDFGGICTVINQHDIPFRIGKRIDSFGPVLFDGLIDEVEVFDRALTAGEIYAIYNAGSAGKCKSFAFDVSIDIKPGSAPNSINPRSRGVIPVAILTTDTFDALDIDPKTWMVTGMRISLVISKHRTQGSLAVIPPLHSPE